MGNVATDVLVLDSCSITVSHTFTAQEKWAVVLSLCDGITPKCVADIELRPGLEKIEQAQVGPLVLSGRQYVLIRRGIRKTKRKIDGSIVTEVLLIGGNFSVGRHNPLLKLLVHLN